MTDVKDSSGEDTDSREPIDEAEVEAAMPEPGADSDIKGPVKDEAQSSVGEDFQALKAEAEKFRDMALRAEAEMQNLRRRSERDVQNAHKFGAERLVQNLLPVLDSLEKAIETSLQAGTAEDDPQLEGLKLCLKLFSEVLEKEGIEVVDPLGQPFDPNVHEALSLIENPDMEPNSVMAVIQKGYRLRERLVRPAMVMVSKAPAGA